MFNLEQHNEILIHLKSISSICRKHSSGWYEIFCPYCDDAIRKPNPNHGHFYVASSFPYGQCFRCGSKVGLDRFLLDTNFTNSAIIQQLKRTSGFVYGGSRKLKADKKYELPDLQKNILHHYNQFQKTNPQGFQRFKTYITRRCYEINPMDFLLLPIIEKQSLGVQFLNYDGNIVTTRLIDSEIRYINPSIKRFYYFQDLNQLDEYTNIILTEGAFDLINLYNYYPQFNMEPSFYIAIGGNNYKGMVLELINTYLLIGKYQFHIVLDNGLKFIDVIIRSTKKAINELNPEVNVQFYLPLLTKDVSECMLLQAI